jgi:cell division protein FtsW
MEMHRRLDEWDDKGGSPRETWTDERGTNSSFTFLCVVVILVLLGLTMLYSASYNEALVHELPYDYFFKRQLLFVGLGFAAAVVIRIVPLSWIRNASYPVLSVALVLMLLTLFTPLGQERLGSRRWLSIGPLPSLQPSELVKISMVLFLSTYFSDPRTHRNPLTKTLVPASVTVLFAVLILAQKDYSSTVLFLGVCLAMFVASGIKASHLLLLLAFLGTAAVAVMLLEPYRVRRLVSFLVPDLDPNGINYQVTNSLKAIRQGGLFGAGLGNGQYKLGLIPEVQSDFIFASICEEIGLLGSALIIVLFCLYAILGYKAYGRTHETYPFLSYLAFGSTTLVVLQAIVNIAVVIGLLPPTGIPLPFFSQGGTNLIVILCASSLLYRVLLVSSGRNMPDEGEGL